MFKVTRVPKEQMLIECGFYFGGREETWHHKHSSHGDRARSKGHFHVLMRPMESGEPTGCFLDEPFGLKAKEKKRVHKANRKWAKSHLYDEVEECTDFFGRVHYTTYEDAILEEELNNYYEDRYYSYCDQLAIESDLYQLQDAVDEIISTLIASPNLTHLLQHIIPEMINDTLKCYSDLFVA